MSRGGVPHRLQVRGWGRPPNHQARNLAPLPADVDHVVAAALPISGLTAWQGVFDHGRFAAGQTVLIHGAAGSVGSIAVQLASESGARVIGTGRAAGRDTALGLGADAFLDLQSDQLEDAGEVDVVFDVIGGDVLDRSAALVRAGGTLVTIAAPPKVQPMDARAVFFVVEPDRTRLADLAQRLRDGSLKPIVGAVRTLREAPSAFAPDRRIPGKTIIRVTEELKQPPRRRAIQIRPSQRSRPLKSCSISPRSTSASSARSTTGPSTHHWAPGSPADRYARLPGR